MASRGQAYRRGAPATALALAPDDFDSDDDTLVQHSGTSYGTTYSGRSDGSHSSGGSSYYDIGPQGRDFNILLLITFLLLLTTTAFYTTHYLLDLGVLYHTFIPGALIKAATSYFPELLRFRLDPSVMLNNPDPVVVVVVQKEGKYRYLGLVTTRFLPFLPHFWRSLVGQSYRIGPVLQQLNWLLVRSYQADAVAFVSGVVFVVTCALASGGWTRLKMFALATWPRRRVKLSALFAWITNPWNVFRIFVLATWPGRRLMLSFSHLFVSLTNPWNVLRGLKAVVFVAAVYPNLFWDLSTRRILLLFACIYYTHHAPGDDLSFNLMLPPRFKLQLFGSFLRLFPRDPYAHQVDFVMAIAQVINLFSMVFHVLLVSYELIYHYAALRGSTTTDSEVSRTRATVAHATENWGGGNRGGFSTGVRRAGRQATRYTW